MGPITALTAQPRTRSRWPGSRSAVIETLLVVAVFVALVAFFRMHDHNAVGASDSYGYMLTAVRLAHGHFWEPEHVLSPFGLPEDPWLTRPLATFITRGGTVPYYPFGYSLLLVPFILVGGIDASAWVSPLVAAGTVTVGYVLGRVYLGRLGGLLTATLIAALPNFVLAAIVPWSDGAAAFCGTVALLALVYPRPRAWLDLVLGGAVGLSFLVRPNTALLALPVAGWLIYRRDWSRLARFALAFAPFVLLEGFVNQRYYGAPWSTGYGQLPLDLTAGAGRRLLRWLTLFNEQQAGVGLAVAALGLAFGRLRPSLRALLFVVAGLTFGFYAFWPFDGDWWACRFLLPALPVIALLQASALTRLAGAGRFRVARSAVLGLGVAMFLGSSIAYTQSHRVLLLPDDELRYPKAAAFVAGHIEQPALVVAMIHSGSLRLYGGLATTRYDTAPVATVMAELRAAKQGGANLYLVADGWEVEQILQSGKWQFLVGAEELGYVDPGHVTLFRLNPLDPATLRQVDALFAGTIRLQSTQLPGEPVRPGSAARITLSWQAVAPPAADYTVFLHLVDQSGKIVAQLDSYPSGDRFLTSSWAVGRWISEVRSVPIPESAAPGRLQVRAGLYQRETLERLPSVGTAVSPSERYAVLGEIEVAAR